MTSLSKSMPHCQYFDPKGVNFMTPMSKKKQCGQDYDKDVMIAGFPLLNIIFFTVISCLFTVKCSGDYYHPGQSLFLSLFTVRWFDVRLPVGGWCSC